jgi:hypothetical protein
MPWTADDAPRFNKTTARSKYLRSVWAEAANAALREYKDEGKAVRVANAAVRKALHQKKSD